MEKRLVFGLLFAVLSLLICKTTQTCFANINDYLGKCKCESETISCMNQEKMPAKIELKKTFEELSKHIKENNINVGTFEELVVVESRADYDDLMFHKIPFRSVEIHETNLTSIDKIVFNYMQDTLKYLLIQSDSLKSFSATIKDLKVLETLYLVMGLRSLRELPANSITGQAVLDGVLIDGVVSTIRSNAINNVPALERIRITNQLETVEAEAFNLGNALIPVVIDLSQNRLTNVSFAEKFIVQNPALEVTLILSNNRLTTLPEKVFMTFLAANPSNKLVMHNNPFECGQCQSEWVVRQFDSGRIVGLTCANSQKTSPWKYNWQCKQGPGSGAISLANSHILLTILFIASAFVLL